MLPAWLRRSEGEHRWQMSVAVLASIGFQLAVPQRLALRPTFLLPALEGALLLGLVAANPGHINRVIVFGFWYWQFDRGGPARRALGHRPYADFLFPQMTDLELTSPDWEPQFFDYLYKSFTNAAAFSPTDVMPLSRWAKVLFLMQSGISLMTAALVVARAVNILR